MPIPPKRKTQSEHAKRRFEERYNVKINSKQYLTICSLFRDGEILAKQSNTRSFRKIIYNDMEIYGIYDKTRKQIAKFLTKEMVEEDLKLYEPLQEKNKEIIDDLSLFFGEGLYSEPKDETAMVW